jgi:putative ABC transport system permease protein
MFFTLTNVLRDGTRTLVRNKMRSVLTVLGIMIGIGAVICVVAIGQAASSQVQQQMFNLGDNFVWIEAGGRAVNGVRTGARGTKTLTLADAEAIKNQIGLLKLVSPNVDSRAQLIYGNRNWSTQYRGVSPEWFEIKRWNLEEGAPFTQDDVDKALNVCVLGRTVRDQLFADEDPIGKSINLKGVPCKVIGVLAYRGQSSFGQDQDDTLILPYTTAQKKVMGQPWLDDILCSAVSVDAIKLAGRQAAELLRERHRIRPGEDDDFNIRNPEDQIQAQLDASNTFKMFLICVGSVALIVGGIGIMNVMLVSVTERTREIGIRMAVGATEIEVQLQFLGEAVLLSLAGGAIGVLVGVVGAIGLGHTLQWPMSVSPQAILIAAIFSIVVGIFFGFYPARKAALLDPIEALRFE